MDRILALTAALLLLVSAVAVADEPLYATGEILVKFREDDEAAADGILQAEKIRRQQTHIQIQRGQALEALIEQYREREDVLWAEPNYLHFLDDIPNDPLYAEQKSYLELMRIPEAWNHHTGSEEVVIAVLDSGVAFSHPDLAANIWTNPAEIPDNGIDDDRNGYVDDVHGWDFVGDDPGNAQSSVRYADDADPDVRQGNSALGNGIDEDLDHGADGNAFHGTFVAGLLAAVGNDGAGIAGCTWNCRIMPLRVFPPDGGAFSNDIAEAVAYAAANGASVMNLSFSSAARSQAVAEAIENAYTAGLVCVASAGNENSNVARYPAALPQVIAVAGSGDAVEHPLQRAPFSNWGAYVDVVAPSVSILSSSVVSVGEAQSTGEAAGTYDYITRSGVSFAVPFVTAMAAWLRSEQDQLSVEGVRALIREQAMNLPDDPEDSPDAGAAWDGVGLLRFVREQAASAQFGEVRAREMLEGTEIAWHTLLETGITEFSVERRNPNQATESVILQVTSHGAQLPYEVIDYSLGASAFYRVVAHASDGTFFRSKWITPTPRAIPENTELLPNFPNPFNPETWIPFRLAEAGEVTITIHDPGGYVVLSSELGYLREGEYTSPKYAFRWLGKNTFGERMPSGAYFYTLRTTTGNHTRRMVLRR